MNCHDRLATVRAGNVEPGAVDKLPKLPKGASGRFGSDGVEHLGNISIIRQRLRRVAEAHDVDEAHVDQLTDLDLVDWAGFNEGSLGLYLGMLVDMTDRHAGRVPKGHVAEIQCIDCGPVWKHPGQAAVLFEVDGWLQAEGCPWCFVNKAVRDSCLCPIAD